MKIRKQKTHTHTHGTLIYLLPHSWPRLLSWKPVMHYGIWDASAASARKELAMFQGSWPLTPHTFRIRNRTIKRQERTEWAPEHMTIRRWSGSQQEIQHCFTFTSRFFRFQLWCILSSTQVWCCINTFNILPPETLSNKKQTEYKFGWVFENFLLFLAFFPGIRWDRMPCVLGEPDWHWWGHCTTLSQWLHLHLTFDTCWLHLHLTLSMTSWWRHLWLDRGYHSAPTSCCDHSGFSDCH